MGFLQLPRPHGRGGVVSFLNVSFLGYWYISVELGDIRKRKTKMREKPPGKAETRAVAKIYSFRLLPWVSVRSRGHLVAAGSLVS